MLTMNRDEARTRGPELPPEVNRPDDAPAWLAPRDSDKGGTWIGVNEHGIVACLLNRYQDYDPALLPEQPRSRGAIIPRLMVCRSMTTCRQLLDYAMDQLADYPPFTLLLASPGKGMRLDWAGTGSVLEEPLNEPWAMVSSSFFESDGVLPWRKKLFDAWRRDGAPCLDGIPDFHRLQPAGKATWAPLMARGISCTRSITQVFVRLDERHVAMRYAPVEADRAALGAFHDPISLPLIEQAGVSHEA